MRKSHPLSRPSLIKLEDLTISLFFSAKINAIVLYIHLQIPITIMKPHEKAEVPTGVIVGSAIAGILLLLALVAVLWKVRNVSYLKDTGVLKTSVLNFLITEQTCFIWYLLVYHKKKGNASLFANSHSCSWKQSVRILSPWSWSLFSNLLSSRHWMFCSPASKQTLRNLTLCNSFQLCVLISSLKGWCQVNTLHTDLSSSPRFPEVQGGESLGPFKISQKW